MPVLPSHTWYAIISLMAGGGIGELIWDQINIRHITEKHGIFPDEVQETCDGNVLLVETYGDRFLVIGETAAGKPITAVLQPRDDKCYVVTARRSARKERRAYLKEYSRGP